MSTTEETVQEQPDTETATAVDETPDTTPDSGEVDAAADDAALATIEKYQTESGGEETGEGEEPSADGVTETVTETPETAPEPIEPNLLSAAAFAGLSEQDLRDTIAAVGMDKAVAAIRTIVDRASAQWGLPQPVENTNATPNATQAAATKQAVPQAPADDAPADIETLLADIEAPTYGKQFTDDFPEGSEMVEGNRKIAKAARFIASQNKQLAQIVATFAEQHHANEAADLYEFYSETDPKGEAYGALAGAPTPEQLSKRQRLWAAARSYQERQRAQGIPVRFSKALRETHAALSIGQGTNPAAKQTQQQKPAAKPRGDLTPSSSGKAPARATDDQQRDQAARATLKKLGWL